MKQGLAEYRAKTKKNWRGWQWNRIVERLSVPPEDATVLYLCGPEDLDRAKALEKGFRSENLIGVDVIDENVRRVRSGGGLAICHDLGELIRSWPEDWPIHVVVADFCAGFDRKIARFGLDLLASVAVSGTEDPFGTVLSLNLQRGRDAWSNQIRAHLHDEKHRGASWIMGFKLALLRNTGKRSVADARDLTRRCADICNTYRSNRVLMDSVVTRLPGLSNREMIQHAAPTITARRKIAACRALRTGKMRAA